MDGNGLPLISITAKADVHDVKLTLPTVDALMIGKRRRRPKRVRADKGYDSAAFRKGLRQRGIRPAVDHRRYEHRHTHRKTWDDRSECRYAPCRWKVERSFACMDQHRRLNFLYERTRHAYDGFLTLARIRCYLKLLSRCRR